MTENGITLASAVVVPDSEQNPTLLESSTSLKRRQSEVSESPVESKRARLSPEKDQSSHQEPATIKGHDTSNQAPAEANVDDDKRSTRRRSGREEERKRGQRMFGVLLGALSSSGGASSKAAQRRADIEKRQAEKLKQLQEDVSQREREQAEERKRTRRKEQWVVDAAAMHARHATMLATARFLSTTTEPKLYYKPWDLLDEEEDQINRQIEEIEEQIDRETDAFEQRRNQALEEENLNDNSTSFVNKPRDEDQKDTTVGLESRPEAPSNTVAPLSEIEDTNTANSNHEPKHDGACEESRDDSHLYDVHQGETVVEAEEDTVIY